MPFCSNCGTELNEGTTFCGNCGQKQNVAEKSKQSFLRNNLKFNFDFSSKLTAIKNHFSNFNLNYNSIIFKLAVIMFIAIGIGSEAYTWASFFIHGDFFIKNTAIIKASMCVVFGLVSSLIIFKLKPVTEVKRSNTLRIIWIVSVVFTSIFFFVYSSWKYILESAKAESIITLMLVISSVLLIYKNRAKTPIVVLVSLISYALSNTNLTFIKLDMALYNLSHEVNNLISIFSGGMGYIIFVVLIFLLGYIFPKKVSKWLYIIPTAAIVLLEVVNLIDGFSVSSVIHFVLDSILIVAALLFALSCSREDTGAIEVVNAQKLKKSGIKVAVISLVSIIVISTVYVMTSAVITSTHINNGVDKWKDKIISGGQLDWESIRKDIFGYYGATESAKGFIDDYYFYSTLSENRNDMEKITNCYYAFKDNKITDEIADDYLSISVDEDWEDDEVLSSYYKKYKAMQPSIENVSVTGAVDINNGEISVTVVNDNKMPISKCTAECSFTIMFIEPGSYSNQEYGRGTKTIEIEDIPGNDRKTETITFNADDYYDSYGSYITAFVWQKNTSITSIE